MCGIHSDETLSYFCFDCESQCICAECVIHGEHLGHEVMQIKKAYPIIKDKVEEMFFNVSNKIDEIELRAEKIETQKKDIIDQGNAAKQQVFISFEDLKNRIEKKEREIIGQIEKVMQDCLKETENYSRIILSKVKAMETISQSVKKVLASATPVDLLDFYAENKGKVLANLESEMSTLGNIDRSTNFRCAISSTSLSEHIDSIKAVQIQISALKCSEDSKSKRFNYKPMQS